MAILFVSGVNDLSKIGVTLDENGQMGYLMDGNCSVHRRLPLEENVAASFLLFGKGVRQHNIEFKRPPSVIFNQIADPDTHRGALERCIELCNQVNTAVINHPSRVLETSRDQVSQKLQGIPGLIMPRTQRFRPRSPDDVFSHAEAEGFEFPCIIRVAGLHGGVGLVRIDGPDGIDSLHAFPFDGREFYLTEYAGYRSHDGLFRKTRLAVVDGVPLIRHHLIDTDWKVHASSLGYMDENASLMNEANGLISDFDTALRPAIASQISEITERLGLDYFGIDCHVNEQGELLIFEANANMNILYNSRVEYRECTKIIEKHILQLIDDRSRGRDRESG